MRSVLGCHCSLGFPPRRVALLRAWVLGWAAFIGSVPAQAAGTPPPRCPGSAIAVVGAVAADFQDICQGVGAARTFLAGLGLADEPVLTVEVTKTLPEEAGATAVGCYLQHRNRAYLKPYAAFRQEGTWFGVPVSRALYRALATHETAHAVAACHFRAPQPSIQAKEYVAYVTMFATMPAALRSRALKAMPGTGFADIGRVSSFVYLFDPMLFGANAYRHFLTLQDPAGFLRQVMAGEVLAE